VSRFAGSALRAGDAAIVVATKAHRHRIAQQLKARGVDLGLAAAQGRYIALDAAETLSALSVVEEPDEVLFTHIISGHIERARAATTSEQRRVAIFGEMVALLWARGETEAAFRLEQMWNRLAHDYSFDLLCGYPMSFFGREADGDLVAKLCVAHSHVIPAESYSSLGDDEGRRREVALLQQKAQALETEVEERRKAQEALERSEAELRLALAARDEFLSAAAHELKTPTTSLQGVAQLLLRDAGQNREISPKRMEFALRVIEQQTGKLSRLVGRLLDAVQLDAGKLQVWPVRNDIAALVRLALAGQDDSGHDFVYLGPQHLEAEVDPDRFDQVITNLLDNAARFSPRGSTVKVELGLSHEGGVRLCVTDQGGGIAPHLREIVFDRFHQGHADRHHAGIGIGLYVTREIVEMHGGWVRIEQPAEGGSRFVVTLPPAPAARAQSRAV